MYNVLVAEDETILLQSLVMKIQRLWPEAQVVAACESGSDAIAAIRQQPVDVAFLDIQMGEVSGVEVARQVAGKCHIIFVTAYDKYAINAFEAGAVDYLLKPFSDDRLAQAIKRLQHRLLAAPTDLSAVLQKLDAAPNPYLQRLKIQVGNRFWFVETDDVTYFEASGRYVKVMAGGRESLLKIPLRSLAQQLCPETFWQIHRSIIINVKQLDYASSTPSDRLQAYMKGYEQPLPVSRTYHYLFRT